MKKILGSSLVPTKFLSLALVSVICLALVLVGCTYHGVFINPPPVGAATALYAEDEESYAGMCRVHGFVHYDGYLYTVNRDTLPGRVYKIDSSDLSQVGNYLALSSSALSDLIEEGGYLWTVDADGILYKVNPSTLTEVDSWEVLAQSYNGCGALCSDGTYIYGTGYDGVFKFTISSSSHWENAIVANKALHSIVESGSYLYVNDATTRYVYKVSKATLEIDSTLTDPTQITDDMAEDGTYVYAGCEVQGPGLYRIRMSDLDYDFYEPTGIGECYGVFIVNERLLYLDYENSKIWVFTYPACSLLRELQFTDYSGSGELNELTFDDEYIYCTQWSYSPSYIAKFSRDDVFGYSDPTVLTDSTVTSVTTDSFVAWGEITATGGDNCHERGICYLEGTSGTPNVDDDTTVYDSGDYGTGEYSKTISGLSEGTGYRIRAYAKNLAGISYGDTYTVYTSGPLGVDTDEATDITTDSFVANGEITGIGESAVTTRGFYYTTKYDDFEWGSDEDPLDDSGGAIDWTISVAGSSKAEIDDPAGFEPYSQTRCARLYRDGTNHAAARYSVSPLDDDDVVGTRLRLDGVAGRVYIYHGNGSKLIFFAYTDDGSLKWRGGELDDWTDTGEDIETEEWVLIEVRNVNWSSGTYDVYHDGVLALQDAEMRALSWYSGEFGYTSYYSTGTIWVDDVGGWNIEDEEGSFEEGLYDLEISGLDSSTSYKVMAFVKNTEGYGYGDVVTCITACLLSISNIPDNKGWGILEVNTTDSTAIDYFTITNTGSCTMDIVIYGSSATGGDDTWTLDDTGTPGENIYALYAGLDDDDDLFDVIVRGTETYNTLVSGLAEEAIQDWGLKIYMPTSLSGYDSQEMTGTITLVASAS